MSEIKVNKISPRAACGTVTLGDSGDTFTIPAGATITNAGTANGFGATGAVNWQTSIKTTAFTAVSGEGYFCDTNTSGAFTVTLPASPSAGDIVAVKDYANTFDTANLTIGRNGSNIGGAAEDSIISTEGIAITLVYADATKGWLVTDSGLQSEAPGSLYVTATGGTITTVGDFKVHQFTGPGTFCVSCGGNAGGSNQIDYMVVAGGGAGGHYSGIGGGGAGGMRVGSVVDTSPTIPIRAPGFSVSAKAYPITIGAGGASTSYPSHNPTRAPNGSPSSLASDFVAAGGGGGARGSGSPTPASGAQTGGSGGGGAYGANPGAAGNTPPVSPPQGNPGGTGYPGSGNPDGGGGGGGAGAAGGTGGCGVGGTGGAGINVAPIFGSAPQPFYIANGTGTGASVCGQFAGGAGGSVYSGTPSNGGVGGGGNGAVNPEGNGKSGTANTGGGGAGTQSLPSDSGAGGSGIVLIRYKFQN
jgi:hypothetical protein|tara:strand:+ start:2583 stop:3998 length:1416 start_codon:yes stop_codon:yes gene_type:complete